MFESVKADFNKNNTDSDARDLITHRRLFLQYPNKQIIVSA